MCSVLSVTLSKSNKIFSFLLVTFHLLLSNSIFASDEVNIVNQLALNGYDPVSYFSGKPVQGNAEIYSIDEQARYLFSTRINKKIFDQDTERYRPMYGGYCAYGVRMGKKLDADPLSYEVIDDRLYLMLNAATYKLWTQDKVNNIQISNRLWPKIQSKSKTSLN